MPDDLAGFLKAIDTKLDLMAQAIGVHPGWICLGLVVAVLFVYVLKAWRKPKE